MFIMENEMQKKSYLKFFEGKTKSSIEFPPFIYSKIKSK